MGQKRKILKTIRGNKKARKRLSRAMKDRKVNRKELKKVVDAGGVTEKQALRIRKRLRKSEKFDTKLSKKKVRSLFPQNNLNDGSTTVDDDESQGFAGTVEPYEGMEFPDYSDQFKGMNDAISSMQTSFGNTLAGLTNQLNAERLAADERMAEMGKSFQQQLAQRGDRPRVSGIRFADRGTGGATTGQLMRKGIRGTFGRSGDRIMQISSLNI
jgi:hypothetical protein